MKYHTLSQRKALLVDLGEHLGNRSVGLSDAVKEAGLQNPWFTVDSCFLALDNIRHHFLDAQKLDDWLLAYDNAGDHPHPKVVALILAGNLPLVGFHDFLCVFISGHYALLKLSDKDRKLMEYLLKWMEDKLHQEVPDLEVPWKIVDKLSGFDAVVATGSDNTARYFHQYFAGYPHIIRANRNSVAVLTGRESTEELERIVTDILQYFGMGCRSVSALLVPEGYDWQPLLGIIDNQSGRMDHSRYQNNLEYQYAIALLNKENFFQTGALLIKEAETLISPVGTVHFQKYMHQDDLGQKLSYWKEGIQCIVSTALIHGYIVVPPGEAQQPGLADYSDGIDTMAFLNNL